MKFFDLVNDIVTEAYSLGLVKKLIAKFEEDGADEDDVIEYIQLFNNIQSKLPPEKRDVTKYDWFELIAIVNKYSSKKIKSKKEKDTISDKVYDKDGIKVFVGADHKGCVKYGQGYNFCISARSAVGFAAMYGNYRTKAKGTPYFLFNDNLDKSNPEHVLVIFVFPVDTRNETANQFQNLARDPRLEGQKYFYSVTISTNTLTRYYNNFNIAIREYPILEKIKSILVPVEVGVESVDDEISNLIKTSYNRKYRNMYEVFFEKFGNKNYKEQTNSGPEGIKNLVVQLENDLEQKKERFPEADFTPRIEYINYLRKLMNLKYQELDKLYNRHQELTGVIGRIGF